MRQSKQNLQRGFMQLASTSLRLVLFVVFVARRQHNFLYSKKEDNIAFPQVDY